MYASRGRGLGRVLAACAGMVRQGQGGRGTHGVTRVTGVVEVVEVVRVAPSRYVCAPKGYSLTDWPISSDWSYCNATSTPPPA